MVGVVGVVSLESHSAELFNFLWRRVNAVLKSFVIDSDPIWNDSCWFVNIPKVCLYHTHIYLVTVEDFGSSELIAQAISLSVNDLSFGAFLDNPAGSSHHSGYKGMDSRTTQGVYILPNCC